MMFAVRARNPQDGGRAEAAAAAAALRFLSRRLVSAPLSVRSCGHSVRRTTSGTLIDATAVTRATHRPGAAEALSVYPQTWQIGSHTTTATATVLREGHDRHDPDWPRPADCSLYTPARPPGLSPRVRCPFGNHRQRAALSGSARKPAQDRVAERPRGFQRPAGNKAPPEAAARSRHALVSRPTRA